MATNTKLLGDRFNEIAATTAASSIVRRLRDLAVEPSTRRFTRQRAEASSLWDELAGMANARAMAAAVKPAATTRRASKPRPLANDKSQGCDPSRKFNSAAQTDLPADGPVEIHNDTPVTASA